MSRSLLAALLLGALWTASAAAEEPEGKAPPATPITGERLTLDGYLRTRSALFYNLDLNRGPTPTTNRPIFPTTPSGSESITTADLRLRLDATYEIVPEVRIHARFDALDNVVLGATPVGYPLHRWAPSAYGSLGQTPPSAGINSYGDSFVVKRAWGEAMLPFGMIVVGRMGMPTWGLGILANPGDGLDQDFDEDVDRLGFATTLFDHIVGASWDTNAVGPTTASEAGTLWGRDLDLDDTDNVHTLSASVLRYLDDDAIRRRTDEGQLAVTYGAWVTWRRQRADVPAWWLDGLDFDQRLTADDLVERDVSLYGVDGTFSIAAPRFRLTAEGAFLTGHIGNLSMVPGLTVDEITLRQGGGVLQADVGLLPADRLVLGFEAGAASGDDSPGMGVAPSLDALTTQPGDLDGPQFSLPDDTSLNNFRFHPNYHVDLILWRQLIGAVTDGAFLRTRLAWQPVDRLGLEAAVIHSRALNASSTPGNVSTLGTEIDLSADWHVWHGLEAQLRYGLLLPGAGLDNPALGLSATPAQAVTGLLAFVY